jgi:hypothetical protein
MPSRSVPGLGASVAALEKGFPMFRGRGTLIGFGVVAVLLLLPSTAYAYIDPGMGSLILQGLAASLLAVAVFWRRLVSFVKNLFVKGDRGK